MRANTKFIVAAFIFVSIFVDLTEQSRVVFKSVTIRHMKKNDVGLIFDAVVRNEGTAPKETLSFDVRSQRCCLLIDGAYDCETQNIIGVKIMNLEADKSVIGTLFWPTQIPYNRIGNCTLEIVSHHSSGTEIDDIKPIHFNTTINLENLHDYMLIYFNDMKKAFGYRQCEHEDLNPFDNCRPVNCELKYFGKRNFFQSPRCVPVAECEEDPEVVYDFRTNSCRDLRKIFSEKEIEEMRRGEFTNWVEKEDEKNDGKSETKIEEQRSRILRRVRRSLNESQTFSQMLLSTALFIVKIVVLIVFLYLMMALLISILFYLCIGCGMISNSVTLNAFERFE